MKKLYFDTEFTGLHQKTTLISIGIVSECGKEFYAELTDFDIKQIDEWLIKNVINNLKYSSSPFPGEDPYYVATRAEDNPFGNDLYESYSVKLQGDRDIVRRELTRWLGQFDKVEMWSDCYAYDWVLFCDIWGYAPHVPDNVYYIPMDLSTLFKVNGIDPDISREEFAEMSEGSEKHNALWDAKIIKACCEKLMN